MDTIMAMFDTNEYLTEVAYQDSPYLKQMEKEFEQLAEYYKKFYGGMKKYGLDPKKPWDVYRYYYSKSVDSDGLRITQYNDNLKKIEDLVKKMFKFRSVHIEFQLVSIYGPHTQMANKSIIVIPYYNSSTGTTQVGEFIDIGEKTKIDGKVRYRVGYKSTVQASNKGIVDTSDSITVLIRLMMYEELTPREYVAVLLHEIGHNLDIQNINIEVKNDAKMIKVASNVAKKSSTAKLPNTMKVLFQIIGERRKTKKAYSEILATHLAKVANSVGYGGENKRGELYADALPTSFGYGPDLIKALNKLSDDFYKITDMKETKNLWRVYTNYTNALIIAARLNRRETDVHGTNMYRLKVIMKQLESDLQKTKDSKIKKRLQQNIKELNAIIEQIENNPEKSEEFRQMIKVWIDHIDV